MDPIQSVACVNCGKNFPIEKIDLHEAYCCRNIRRCELCSQMIDVNEMEHHHNQMHKKQSCNFCQAEFQAKALTQHEQVCPRRPVVCRYCENHQPFEQIPRHEDVCGARTKPCSICSRLVSLRDLQGHENRCQRRREQRAEVSQDQYRNQRRNQLQRIERERQNSTNQLRDQPRSNSIQNKLPKPHKIKPNHIIGPEIIKPAIDPVPISIRLALKNKDQRVPLKTRN